MHARGHSTRRKWGTILELTIKSLVCPPTCLCCCGGGFILFYFILWGLWVLFVCFLFLLCFGFAKANGFNQLSSKRHDLKMGGTNGEGPQQH